MTGFEGIGKALITIGVFLVVFGLLFVFWQKIPLLGRLPGDITFQKGDTSFFFPVVTSLVISLILTVLVNIILRLFK
ncbi:MAG: DUF2905 domain-containing protein [Dehalococcoidales bacterium]|nr:DUF2905 domain-containing protein [Dehalococcoidales bacterium]